MVTLDEVRPALAMLIGGAAAVLGLVLPDFDTALGLGHRSGLTHGLLLPLGLAMTGWRLPWLQAVAAGLAIGIAVNCAADLFPQGMRGFATIKLPFLDGTGAPASIAWLAATLLLGLAVPLLAAEARFGGAAMLVAAAAVAVLALAYLILHREPVESLAAVGGALVLSHPAGRRALAERLSRRRHPQEPH